MTWDARSFASWCQKGSARDVPWTFSIMSAMWPPRAAALRSGRPMMFQRTPAPLRTGHAVHLREVQERAGQDGPDKGQRQHEEASYVPRRRWLSSQEQGPATE